MPPEFNKLIHGLSYEDYAAQPGLRASHLKKMRRSPAHFKASMAEEKKPSAALEFGKKFHFAIENPEKFRDLMVIEPEFVGKTKDGRDSTRSAEAKEKKAIWYSDLRPDQIVVTAEESFNLTGMLNSVTKHKLVGKLIRTGVRETSLWTKDPETDLDLQCRFDFISEYGHPVDFKTTMDASKGSFTWDIFSDKFESSPFYILAAAHYAHIARVSKQVNGESFYLVAVEKEPPWGVVVYPLDLGALDVGERHRARLTRQYAQCVKTGEWPCYEERAVPTEIPQWVKWDEQMPNDVEGAP